MKIKHIFIAASIVFISSCEGILTEEPQDFIAPEQFFKSEAEVTQAIYGVYDFLNISEVSGRDAIEWGENGTDVGSGRVRLWRDGDLDNFGGEPSFYRDCYKAVGAANMVISRVENAENLSDDFKNRVLGEARFLRAYFYSRLYLFYGNIPVWLDELNFDKVEKLPNTQADQVLEQIIQDLIHASNNLPPSADEEGRITEWAAKGLLARMYLFDDQWPKAKELALDIVENSGHELLPLYSEVFDLQQEFNAELIHVIPKQQDIEGSQMHTHSSPRPFDDGPKIQIPEGESIIRPDGKLTTDLSSRSPGSLQQGWGTIQCLKEYYDSFQPGDKRREMWWHDITFTDGTTYEFTGGNSCGEALNGRAGYYPLKYIAWDTPLNNGPRDLTMQRLAEIYLILAEAENEINGPTAVAYNAINILRRRAFGDTDHDLSGLSKEEFRQAIIDENKWELGGEGHRKWYLWHWGFETYQEAAESVSESLPLLIQNLKPHHRYWKIPDTELAKNPNLKQNPGYSAN